MFRFAGLLVVVSMIAVCQGYSTGPPSSGSHCKEMRPVHGQGTNFYDGNSKYQLTQSPNADGSYTVTLGSENGPLFKGYMIWDTSNVGDFENAQNIIHCNRGQSIATHSGPEQKNMVTLLWRPRGVTGNVPTTFQATVVEHQSEVYENIETHPIRV